MQNLSDRQRLRSLEQEGYESSPVGLDPAPQDKHGWLTAMSLVIYSCSLVLIMATALFVSVGFNPRDESYGKLPWAYALVCLFGSAVCRMISYRFDPDHPSRVKVERVS